MATISPDSTVADGIPEYRYEPLVAADAVRVLVVHPADRLDDPLRCSIVQYTHSAELSIDNYCNDRHYSAVSYTWGSGLLSHQLLVVEPLDAGTISAPSGYHCLKITANVDSLVRHLRKAHKAVHLWIDAVCLNQKDDEEKAQQIPKMGDIYSAAKKVHIWLGNDNIDDARRAFSILWQIELRKEWDPSQDEVSLLTKFFKREWFARRWIIQEAVLAREARLHCGSYSLALSWVVLALRKIQYSATGLDALGYGVKMLLFSMGKYQEAPGDCSLLTLLRDLHLSECSDPRDRVAALYGLASDSTRPSDLRSYNVGVTQLYLDCAVASANSSGTSANALILHLAEFGSLPEDPQRREPLSWVPDWSRSRRQLLEGFNGSQAVLKQLNRTIWPEGGTSTVLKQLNRTMWPEGGTSIVLPTATRLSHSSRKRTLPGLEDYCKRFNHPTHMSAEGNVLRVHSHPVLFLQYGGIVQEVYCCESSDWKDVWSLFRRMADELDKNSYEKIEGQLPNHVLGVLWLLTTIHKIKRGKKFASIDGLEDLIYSSRLSHSPSEEDMEFLEGIGSILSRYSLIRANEFLEARPEHRAPVYHLGPHNAAVDDLQVPFMIPSKSSYSGNDFGGYWTVSMCFRPTQRADMNIFRERKDAATPFYATVRWVGLTFKHTYDAPWLTGNEAPQANEVFCNAIKSGLPGPYILDVV